MYVVSVVLRQSKEQHIGSINMLTDDVVEKLKEMDLVDGRIKLTWAKVRKDGSHEVITHELQDVLVMDIHERIQLNGLVFDPSTALMPTRGWVLFVTVIVTRIA